MSASHFSNIPGLIPRLDGRTWKTEDDFGFYLPDGSEIVVPKGFITDLASVPPLGVIGGIVMLIPALLLAFIPQFAPYLFVLIAAGFAICIASAYLKPYGRYTCAAVLHDWLFYSQRYSFTKSNWILFIAMSAERVALWERLLIWFNVQMFGWIFWRDDSRKNGRLDSITKD